MSQKISQLPAVIAANISDTDILPIVATNITSKVTVANLRTKLGTQPPTGGRTVTDAFTYLTNNAVFNVKDFGAFGDGVTDDTIAFQTAATNVPNGGVVLVPLGQFVIKGSIKNTIGKDVTWVLQGTILDRITSWTDITNDLTLNGKGVIAFSGGHVSVIGNGRVHFDGGANVVGVSQTQRHLFYFYNTSNLLIQGLVTIRGIGRAVGTYACNNIIHRDCDHSGGYAIVVHRSPNNCIVDNVNTRNGTDAGISIGNRGFIDQATLPWTRAVNAQLLNSLAYNIQNGDVSFGTGTVTAAGGAATFSVSQAGILANGMGVIVNNVQYIVSAFSGTTTCTLSGAPTFGASAFAYSTGTSAFSAGVGLTIDSTDGWILKGNLVDGLNLGTFAYSLADSTNGSASNNVALNYNNVHIGVQLSGGLAFEIVRCNYCTFKANVSKEVICLYQISDSLEVDVDGTYVNVLASTQSLSDAASAAFAMVTYTAAAPDNIKIGGTMYGGNTAVVTSGNIKKLTIQGLHVRETFTRFMSGLGGGTIDTLIISDSSWFKTGNSVSGCLSQPSGVVTNVDINGFRAIAGGITAGQAFCDFGSVSSRVRAANVVMKNFDTGFALPAVVMTELRLRDVDFDSVNTKWTGIANVVNFSARGVSVAGVAGPAYGKQGLGDDFLNVLAYSASITPDAQNGNLWQISVSNGVAFTINAPLNPPVGGGNGSGRINLKIKNVSGGAMGAVTFNAFFKQNGFAVANATNGNSTSADFAYDTANGLWVQITPWTVNIPN